MLYWKRATLFFLIEIASKLCFLWFPVENFGVTVCSFSACLHSLKQMYMLRHSWVSEFLLDGQASTHLGGWWTVAPQMILCNTWWTMKRMSAALRSVYSKTERLSLLIISLSTVTFFAVFCDLIFGIICFLYPAKGGWIKFNSCLQLQLTLISDYNMIMTNYLKHSDFSLEHFTNVVVWCTAS